MDFIKEFDGTGRQLRESQEIVLNTLSDLWDSHEVFAVVSPVGSGKSAIARAIQLQTNAAIITSSNILVDQYINTYPTMNSFIGADNYPTRYSYEDARVKACYPENHNIFNPISWLIAKRQKDFEEPDVIIWDECHASVELLKETATRTFSLTAQQRFRADLLAPENLRRFLLMEIAEATCELKGDCHWRVAKKLQNKIDKIEIICDILEKSPETLAIYYEESQTKRGKPKYWLKIKPVTLPLHLIKRFFGKSKVVLLSATLLTCDLRELLAGARFCRIEVESSIPKEKRPIIYRPLPENLSFGKWSAQEVANHIDEILEKVPLRPAIVHCTYNDAKRISEYLRTPHYTHTKESKLEVLNEWMEKGGVLLGSGMAEGIDLKGDLCRLNILLKLAFPNLGDAFVQKRMSLPSGEEWYGVQAVKHIVQAVGRSTRSENDWSATFILDSRFTKLYNQYREMFPEFFREAISWVVPQNLNFG
jgi:Rad3-related DNA helicase